MNRRIKLSRILVVLICLVNFSCNRPHDPTVRGSQKIKSGTCPMPLNEHFISSDKGGVRIAVEGIKDVWGGRVEALAEGERDRKIEQIHSISQNIHNFEIIKYHLCVDKEAGRISQTQYDYFYYKLMDEVKGNATGPTSLPPQEQGKSGHMNITPNGDIKGSSFNQIIK